MNYFHTPNLVKKLYPNLIWSIPTTENKVYLTFDDGPNEVITDYILNRLLHLNWKATFFCVGENVSKNPTLYQRIIDEGHTVGNHTYQHLNAWKNTKENYLQDIQKAQELIHSPFFRPPYGKLTKPITKEIQKDFKIIMWDFMAYDFDQKIKLETIREKAKKHIQPGSIIVLHDNEKFIQREKEVFEIIVEVLTEKGLESITI